MGERAADGRSEDVRDDQDGAFDTSDWLCESCPFEDGYRATLDTGLTSVSDEASRFGNATGLDSDGLFPLDAVLVEVGFFSEVIPSSAFVEDYLTRADLPGDMTWRSLFQTMIAAAGLDMIRRTLLGIDQEPRYFAQRRAR